MGWSEVENVTVGALQEILLRLILFLVYMNGLLSKYFNATVASSADDTGLFAFELSSKVVKIATEQELKFW